MHQGSISAKFGLPGADRIIAAADEHASVYTYQCVDAVLPDAATCSSSWYHFAIGEVIGRPSWR